MTVDVVARREELLALRARLLTAAEDLVHDDDEDGELNSAGGDQHLADHATDMVDREIDDSLEENADPAWSTRSTKRCGSSTTAATAPARHVGEIPEERLAAVPYATLCVRDKRAPGARLSEPARTGLPRLSTSVSAPPRTRCNRSRVQSARSPRGLDSGWRSLSSRAPQSRPIS